MKLIEKILSEENLNEAMKRVEANKGTSGVDKMQVSELESYFKEHKEEIKTSIMEMKYKPQPVRRVYIPKPNGKKRPLGIPTVADRVIQQAIAQVLSQIYDASFSENSYGFRPNRSAHDAIEKVLVYLNEGYEWVIDLDIEKYFDTVNHDKLISILREKVNDKTTLHLIRAFLRAGVMENGLVSPTEVGVPQGGPLSPILSNIYLDKFDKENTRIFFDVIDRRASKEGPNCMIFTSNKSPSQWKEDFDEDDTLLCALDRIFDNAIVYMMDGKSYRGRKLETVAVKVGSTSDLLDPVK